MARNTFSYESLACGNGTLGGQFSIDLDIFVNKYLRQSLTFVNVEPRSYITQTNLSRTSLSVSDMAINDDSPMNVAVVSGRACHVRQAVFSPLPANCEVVSDPVKAWKKGRAL